jgi:predicted transcriptional regulator
MDSFKIDTNQPPTSSETEAESQRRFAWEAAMIAEADAEIEAGLYIDADEIDAWIDSIDTDHELPPPPTRHA